MDLRLDSEGITNENYPDFSNRFYEERNKVNEFVNVKMSCKNINEIEKYFLSCAALKSFGFQGDVSDAWYYSLEGQKILLKHTVCHPLVKQWPINPFYMRNFLKAVITQLESKEYEVLDEIYTIYCELLELQDLDVHYKHYVLNKDHVKAISLMESNGIISCGTTGLCTWQASLPLAEWGLQEQEFLRNKRVLELGSGIGLSGLAIALCCETQCFCFSDVHPEVLRRLKSNILLNIKSETPHNALLASQVTPFIAEKLDSGSDANTSDSDIMLTAYANNTEILVLNLPWENVDKSKALHKIEPFDVILAADVVYDSSLFNDLCKAVCYFVSKGSCTLFLACAVRNEDTLDAFLELLRTNALTVKEQVIPNANHFIFSNEVPVILYKISNYG